MIAEKAYIKEESMSIDNYMKSGQLLERIANSIAERNPNLKNFCFSIAEIAVVEEWLKELIEEIRNETDA